MGCKARWVRAKRLVELLRRVGEGRVPDVEPAGAVKFRIVGETDGSPYDSQRGGAAAVGCGYD
ncbi:hypothetical protein GCM10017784_14170 [Deinococcus indicus]|nr:hypothetical protein GCM10017784_14170 [Deinococcus indicus]